MSSSHIESESKNIKQKLPTRPFMVHWLNNKEYEFEMGAHRILTETSFLTEKNETKGSARTVLFFDYTNMYF
jgi:hypothetical protein